jgi:hypothetical protein
MAFGLPLTGGQNINGLAAVSNYFAGLAIATVYFLFREKGVFRGVYMSIFSRIDRSLKKQI